MAQAKAEAAAAATVANAAEEEAAAAAAADVAAAAAAVAARTRAVEEAVDSWVQCKGSPSSTDVLGLRILVFPPAGVILCHYQVFQA